jgi:hypothetical protein
MGRLTLREALASNLLEAFVRQEEGHGVELANGSDLERALALLITQRRLVAVACETKMAPAELHSQQPILSRAEPAASIGSLSRLAEGVL